MHLHWNINTRSDEMKTYKEVIEILKKQVTDAVMSGSSNPLFSVSEQFYIVAEIYGVTEERVRADVRG